MLLSAFGISLSSFTFFFFSSNPFPLFLIDSFNASFSISQSLQVKYGCRVVNLFHLNSQVFYSSDLAAIPDADNELSSICEAA